jgi:hypothetical protein
MALLCCIYSMGAVNSFISPAPSLDVSHCIVMTGQAINGIIEEHQQSHLQV